MMPNILVVYVISNAYFYYVIAYIVCIPYTHQYVLYTC